MSKAEGIQSWEQSDFPILCDSCLGTNPAIRMTKERFGQECKVCLKPFTVFRWCPGSGCRYRKTEICQACAKLKNVCQSCMFDLEYGLPVGVRDAVLQVKQKVPQLEVNREYFNALNASRLSKGDVGLIKYENVDPASKLVLEELSKKLNGPKSADLELEAVTEPVKKRNLPPVCSFYAKGSCSRGEYCPYRHELSAERPPNLKSYRDRYYGQEDPLAEKLLEKLPEIQTMNNATQLAPPEKEAKAFCIAGIKTGVDEASLRSYFEKHGSLKKVVITGSTALVEYSNRAMAETAAESCVGMVDIEGIPLKVSWAKVKSKNSPAVSRPAVLPARRGSRKRPSPDGDNAEKK